MSSTTNSASGTGSGRLSTPALAGILTAVCGVLLALLIWMIVLLFRAAAAYRRLVADLEERGISVTGPPGDIVSTTDGTARPRAVLQRNTLAPYRKTGWGSLTSKEYVGEDPFQNNLEDEVIKARKPSLWFRLFNKSDSPLQPATVRLTTLKGQQLSAIIESPPKFALTPPRNHDRARDFDFQSSPPVPRDSIGPHTEELSALPPFDDGSSEVLPCTPSSCIPEPLFSSIRKVEQETIENKGAEGSSMSRIPQLRNRSASVCSQSAGEVPSDPVPPLPLSVLKLKEEERGLRPIQHRFSRQSVSSMESAGSSILAGSSSPVRLRGSSTQLRTGPSRDWKNSLSMNSRNLFDPIKRPATYRSQVSIQSSIARYSRYSDTSEVLARDVSDPAVAEMMQTKGSGIATPTYRARTHRSLSTPRRYAKSRVNTYGSPSERRLRVGRLALQDVSGNQPRPVRQNSQNSQASSTRSSNGNPFQWDPSPLLSGKPSALKGSPNARKGHRRQNCVRIVVEPTILNPSKRSSSPSTIHDIVEEATDFDQPRHDRVSRLQQTARSLPRPPSASVFAPDVVLRPTILTASLTSNSPTLSMASYYSVNYQSGNSSPLRRSPTRMSNASTFNIPKFPSPGKNGAYFQREPAPAVSLTRPSNELGTDDRPKFLVDSTTLVQGNTSNADSISNISRERPSQSPYSAHLNYSPSSVSSHRSSNQISLSSNGTSTSKAPQIGFSQAIPATIDPSIISEAGWTYENFTTCGASSASSSLPKVVSRAPSTKTRPIFETIVENKNIGSPNSPRTLHRSLPEPGRHTLIGPRPAPGTSLCTSIAALRRMNSDASVYQTGGNRRYLSIGRESTQPLPGCWDSSSIVSYDGYEYPSDFVVGSDMDPDLDEDITQSIEYAMDDDLIDNALKGLVNIADDQFGADPGREDDISAALVDELPSSNDTPKGTKSQRNSMTVYAPPDSKLANTNDDNNSSRRNSSSTITVDESELGYIPGMGCFAVSNFTDTQLDSKLSSLRQEIGDAKTITPDPSTLNNGLQVSNPDVGGNYLNVWEDGENFWHAMINESAKIESNRRINGSHTDTDTYDGKVIESVEDISQMRPRSGSDKENLAADIAKFKSNAAVPAKKAKITHDATSAGAPGKESKVDTSSPRSATMSTPRKRKSARASNTPTPTKFTPTKLKKRIQKDNTPSGIANSCDKRVTSQSCFASPGMNSTLKSGGVLGGEQAAFETPTFRMKILRATPSHDVAAAVGTPGSLYDGDGFLKG